MGMDQKVTFAGTIALWDKMLEQLATHGFPVQVRMIDGELAFPDEVPPENWRELRVGTPQGMVTLRRERDGVTLVTWGNADPDLQRAWNALTWACAAASNGQVQMETGPLAAADYQRVVDLPGGWKG